jgi:hypothetical protein
MKAGQSPAFLFCGFSRPSGSSRIHQTKSMEPENAWNLTNLPSLTQCKYMRRNSMINRLMISVAAVALVAGSSGFANAQGMGREGGAGREGAGMQQSAPSSPAASPTATTPGREGSEGMKSTQSEEKGGMKGPRAQQDMKSDEKSSTTQSAQEGSKADHSKGMSSQNEEKGTAKGTKAESEERNGNMKAEGREGRDTNTAAGAKEGDRSTVGQAGANAKLTTEQRTKITTVIRDQHVAPVTNVNFSISIGTRVPREVGFHPLPTEIVTIYPDWRGYEFFLVRDQIVVVDPRTLEIVAVLEA